MSDREQAENRLLPLRESRASGQGSWSRPEGVEITMKDLAIGLTCLLVGTVAFAQQVTIETGVSPYQKTSGVSGNINSIGPDTINNLMALWGEAFQKMYPNARIQIEGK